MRIAFIGFGEVAAAFSAALAARGAQVSAYDVLPAKREAAERLGVSFAALSEALQGADYVLSTVTTSVARHAAQQCAPHLRAGQTYVDLNATEPALKRELGRIIDACGAQFVEGAILGAVGVSGAKTEILLGGPAARRAERDLAGRLGLNARFYSEEIGKASMFKMLRSVFSKGMEALLIEFLVAGERAGIREDLWKEVTGLFAAQPFEKVAANWVRSHASAYERRYHEVRQVAGVLRGLGIEPTVTAATEAFFARSRGLGLRPAADMDEVVRQFNQSL
ncbi:MAG TPA: prephenate dehydrogenase/arogenate dehydrogenase family protein [Burkholderiales bacterium]|nr:prephenate dehydrogenase/arogenate dehydrogenase family protein [Burkholderiales bacterium]